MARFDDLLETARRGLSAWEAIPEDQLRTIAASLHPADVADLLAKLDNLSEEFAKLPAWDGDAHDDVASAQHMYAQIIGLLTPSLRPEAEKGLASLQPRSRIYVATGLEAHGARARPALEAALAQEVDPDIRQMIADTITRLRPW